MSFSKSLPLNKLRFLLTGHPHERDDVIALLRRAKNKDVFDEQALSMLEGVLQVSQMRVGDIMIPRSQMVVIEKQETMEEFLPKVIESHHSRFPVYNEELDNINGILLAKDLLPFLLDRKKIFDIRPLLRQTIFVPESKRLNTLLREFRANKNHMAIVVDEYGHVSGLITIEDVLEQIVGEIEDEHDIANEDAIKKHDEHTYIVKAILPMEEFNDYFSRKLDDEGCDTIGGLVLKHFGHVPEQKEKITIGSYTFTVLHADARRIHVLRVTSQ
jgi:magnesium and cobalt transporter